MIQCHNPACVKHVVCRYITKNGKKIYPKRSRFFSFCYEAKEKATRRRKQVA